MLVKTIEHERLQMNMDFGGQVAEFESERKVVRAKVRPGTDALDSAAEDREDEYFTTERSAVKQEWNEEASSSKSALVVTLAKNE